MPKHNCKHERDEFVIHRVGARRYTYHRCLDCPFEWTEVAVIEDPADPVSSDEILEVHQQLAGNKTLADLIGRE